MNFSQRYDYKPLRDTIQIESMDEPLRNGIWNVLRRFVWSSTHSYSFVNNIHERLWADYFKEPLDELDDDPNKVFGKLRSYFFNCQWYEVYDFVEFMAHNYEEPGDEISKMIGQPCFHDKFTHACNNIFEKEMSGYRFIEGRITRITDPHELTAIEEAIRKNQGPVAQHIQRALELLSDRNVPDYRNSIKESISAVEALVRKEVNTERGNLSQILKKLEGDKGLHPALKAAFNSLYGYTSDESGIRHALMDADTVDFPDAKLMLVMCAAFVNFVTGKYAKESTHQRNPA